MAFGAAGQVRDQHVGVKVGVAGAAGPMPEPGREEPVTGRGVDPSRAAPHDARVLFQPPERGDDGVIVRVAELGAHVGVGEGVHDRHRLRGREGEIETRGPVRPGPVQPDSVARVDTLEHRMQRRRLDRALEAERGGMRAEPQAGGFADTEVVVLAAGRDRVQVIRRA